jgi:hypothetical protein
MRREFGRWFGVALDGGAFTVGQRACGHVTYPGYGHVIFAVVIERVERERCLSWRWQPAAIERGVDYSQEATSLSYSNYRKPAMIHCGAWSSQALIIYRRSGG